MATETVCLRTDIPEDPRYAACYASGSVFKAEEGGKFHRVEKGRRTVVSRALCVMEHFGAKCRACPNHSVSLTWRRAP